MARTVLITGTSRGLGQQLQDEFYLNEWNVLCHSRSDYGSSDIYGDLRNNETIIDLASAAKQNNLDILINNAGVYYEKDFLNCTLEQIMEMIETNLIAPIKLIQAIWPIFKKRGGGLIVNINSIVSKIGNRNETIYALTKQSLNTFSKSIRQQAKECGIKILDIYLGAMKTDMTKDRSNYNDLMCPIEVAHKIVHTITEMYVNYNTLWVSELTINRT